MHILWTILIIVIILAVLGFLFRAFSGRGGPL